MAATREFKVKVAKDIIKQVKARKYVAENGMWVGIASATLSRLVEETGKTELKDLLPKVPKCNVCQVGAMALSIVRFEDNCPVDSYGESPIVNTSGTRNETINRVVGVFGRQQTRLMEIAFEFGEGGFSPRTPEERRAVKFGAEYYSSNTRMIAICENIIKNKGTFKV